MMMNHMTYIRLVLLAIFIVTVSGCALTGVSPNAAEDRLRERADGLLRQSSMSGQQEMLGMAGYGYPISGEHIRTVWDRVKLGLLLKDYYDHPRVEEMREFYLAKERYFPKLAENASPYLHHIATTTGKMQIPQEIALLPAIESYFNPKAYSPMHAAGLWQFISSTGRRYGLRQNRWYDGRRDVVASTDAALNYLYYLYDYFDQDWLKAIAAYNCGEGAVQKAVNANLQEGKPTDFWSLDLPEETEQFVPRLLAVSSVIANPEEYNVELPEIPDRQTFNVINTDKRINLSQAANYLGIDYQDLLRLNPAYKRGATEPDADNLLLLPADKVEEMGEEIVAALSQAETEVEEQADVAEETAPRKRSAQASQAYRVRSGDTLAAIARQFNTTAKVLRKLNDLRSNALATGVTLRVPVSRNVKSTSTAQAKRRSHIIQPGDSLWNIARRYGVNISKLSAINAVKPNTVLHTGMQLVLPD